MKIWIVKIMVILSFLLLNISIGASEKKSNTQVSSGYSFVKKSRGKGSVQELYAANSSVESSLVSESDIYEEEVDLEYVRKKQKTFLALMLVFLAGSSLLAPGLYAGYSLKRSSNSGGYSIIDLVVRGLAAVGAGLVITLGIAFALLFGLFAILFIVNSCIYRHGIMEIRRDLKREMSEKVSIFFGVDDNIKYGISLSL